MRYKIERFRDFAHMEGHDKDPQRIRPYNSVEKEYGNTDILIQHLELERRGAKESAVYRVVPMTTPFIVEVNVDIVVESHMGSTS